MVVNWIARSLSLLVSIFFGVFLVDERLTMKIYPMPLGMKRQESIRALGLFLMIGGLLVGWGWAIIGASVSIIGYFLHCIADRRLSLFPFVAAPVVSMLYIFSWFLSG
jgi:hypothetical protein